MRRFGVVVGVVAATMVLASVAAVPAGAATVRQRLSSAVVPASCQMPAQRLHDAVTQKKYLPKRGAIELQGAARPIAVHLTHSGTQLLAQYECSAGGNGADWPAMIVLYNRHNSLSAHLSLARYTNAEHAAVTSWHAYEHTVRVAWVSYQGAGTHLHHHHATLTYSHGELHLT